MLLCQHELLGEINMNKFTFTSLKFTLFTVFLMLVGALLLVLFLGPCYRDTPTEDDTPDIPAVVYLSDTDTSASDLSGSDISLSDIALEE